MNENISGHFDIIGMGVKILLALAFFESSSCQPQRSIALPRQSDAARVALEIGEKTFGSEIHKELPFIVRLRNDSTWIIDGTTPDKTAFFRGGTMHLELDRYSGKVKSLMHGK